MIKILKGGTKQHWIKHNVAARSWTGILIHPNHRYIYLYQDKRSTKIDYFRMSVIILIEGFLGELQTLLLILSLLVVCVDLNRIILDDFILNYRHYRIKKLEKDVSESIHRTILYKILPVNTTVYFGVIKDFILISLNTFNYNL